MDYAPERKPILIKTQSMLGSGDWVQCHFIAQSDGYGIKIRFSSTLEYEFSWCSYWWRVFPTTPPTTTNKVWKITLDKTAGITVIVHCNGIKVFGVPMTCHYEHWRYFWSRSAIQIRILQSDSIAPFYYSWEKPDGKKNKCCMTCSLNIPHCSN